VAGAVSILASRSNLQDIDRLSGTKIEPA